METESIRSLVVASPLGDLAACRGELAAIQCVRGLLDAREMRVAARLDELAAAEPAVFPEDELAKAAKSSLKKASKVRARQRTADDVPQLADALAAGATTGDRVDAVAAATAGLSQAEKARVAARGDELARAAVSMSEGAFRRLLDQMVRQARADDGLAKLARQKNATRLRWWTDDDGMLRLDGRFDPVTGVELTGRIRNQVERLFHGTQPDGCPSDPLERQQFLQAHALLALCEGRGGAGAPDVTVLIDAQSLLAGWHEGTVLDCGTGVLGLPIETVRRLACLGEVTPIIVGADGVRLLLGRETRLANRAQRRALRAAYRTCALCDTPFEFTEAHHVHWSTHGGPTDIHNLVPLCRRHHGLVHEGGWQLQLDADRTLTVTTPGGAVTIHGPPLAMAA
ncbi:MAG: HNH endonuclease [Actinomycetota bacterium]|nr:HNH endonuclease [Actinomycetota bacterium]